ncbi:MAG: glycosyltransferase family 4 protein [Candidatus Paceibacterota bacterium]|jgi:glycosyltransferase involved in cell wall biosynthesis
MKIAYIADIRLPTEKAHGLQIMKTCEALAKEGNEIDIFVPSWNFADEKEILKYYSINQKICIKKVPAMNTIRLGPVGYKIRSFLFARNVSNMLRGKMYDAVYTRDEIPGVILAKKGHNVFYEMHDVRKSGKQRSLLSLAKSVLTISNGLRQYCISLGVDGDKIFVVPDSVDVEQFHVRESQEEARNHLGLPLQKKIVLYSGHLYAWKGADTLADAADLLPENVVVVFVGGTPHDVKSFRDKYGSNKKIIIEGQEPHDKIPYYLRAADVLVIPNSAKEDISRLYTSPIKLFEYMASGTPIVASDLPSIREIVGNGDVCFAKPDGPKSFADCIRYLLDNPAKAGILSSNSLAKANKYTWNQRAKQIQQFIHEKSHRGSNI